MKIRKSFIIRWLFSVDEKQHLERSVIDIEYIQTGAKQRVSTLEEAAEWMRKTDEAELIESVSKSI